MSSVGKSIPDIPAETFQAARKVYHIEHVYLSIGDHLGEILAKVEIPKLDPRASLSTDMTARLALVTAFQYAEHLPDGVASDASRERVDWKYALHLPVHHRGVSGHALCAFRQELFASKPAMQEYDRFLDLSATIGLFARTPSDPLISSTVLSTICQITRLHRLYTSMKAALALLATTAPNWLRANMPPHWYQRYKTGRLHLPYDSTNQIMEEEAIKFASDIQFLLTALREQEPADLSSSVEIQEISCLLANQFFLIDNQFHWRRLACVNCASELM